MLVLCRGDTLRVAGFTKGVPFQRMSLVVWKIKRRLKAYRYSGDESCELFVRTSVAAAVTQKKHTSSGIRN